jgi:RNA polymerase sigma-70 factor (ECF subfamily)
MRHNSPTAEEFWENVGSQRISLLGETTGRSCGSWTSAILDISATGQECQTEGAMNPELIILEEQFERKVWDPAAEALAGWESLFFGTKCFYAGVNVREVCELQSDETLAIAVQKGFSRSIAFQVLLVERYGRKLASFLARRGCHYCHDQSDFLQTLWLRMWTSKLQGYDPKRPFGCWLFVVTRNLLLEDLRRRKPEPITDRDVPDRSAGAEQEVQSGENIARIGVHLGQLPEPQRRALELLIDDKKPAEIAGILGLPIQRVHKLLFLGRRALEKKLGDS